MSAKFRIGQGFDVHVFAENRKLILGGVEIPHSRGLLGHSDADALLHAVVDALLGAIGQEDIGALFPDTDNKWKGADSKIFLEQVWSRVKQEGWQICNLDCSILLQAPKIAPYRSSMRATIAKILELSEDQVTIKATTTEKLGFVGREEGILTSAVVLLERA